MNDATVKITQRVSGYSALVEYPWGAKVRLSGYETESEASEAAETEINRKRAYTLNKDLSAVTLGRKGGQRRKEKDNDYCRKGAGR